MLKISRDLSRKTLSRSPAVKIAASRN